MNQLNSIGEILVVCMISLLVKKVLLLVNYNISRSTPSPVVVCVTHVTKLGAYVTLPEYNNAEAVLIDLEVS